MIQKHNINKRQNRLVHFALNFPKLCLLITVVFTAISAFLALNIQSNTTPYFLGKEHKERVKEDAMAQSFTQTNEAIAILLSRKDTSKTIFDDKTKHFLEKLHYELEQLDLIELLPPQLSFNKNISLSHRKDTLIELYNASIAKSTSAEAKQTVQNSLGQYIYPIKSIKSLINSDDIADIDDEIIVGPNFAPSNINNPLFLEALVDRPGYSTVIQVELNVLPDDSEATAAIFHKVESLTERLADEAGFEAMYAGAPVVNVEISNIMEADNQRYFPLIIVLITIILSFIYKNIWAPLLALSISVLTIIITFGVMSLLGITLNIVTTILPIFIITIGVTDAIHVLSVNANDAKDCGSDILSHKLYTLFRAMLLTSLTTALGFFSLSYTEIGNIRDFGVMVGLGTLVAFILSVTTLPALIKVFNYQLKPSIYSNVLFTLIENKAKTFSNLHFISLVSLILLFSASGLPKFIVDQQNLNSFSSESQVRQDDEKMNQIIGGTVPISVWIKTEQNRGVLTKDILTTIEAIETFAEQHELIGYSVSLASFLRQMHTVLNPDESSTAISKLETDLISQYLFLLEGSSQRDLETVAKVGTYTETRLILMSKTDSSKAVQQIINQLQHFKNSLPVGATMEFASYGSMNSVAAKEIVYGQLNSIIISILGLLVILSFVHKSLILAVITLTPLTLSLLISFGLMGHTGIPLDIGSSLLCGIAFGIGIDYSIHIIEAFKRAYQELGCEFKAKVYALTEVSYPILSSALTISLGFSILLLSDFKPIFNLGLLVSLTMLISALCALFIVPHLLQLRFRSSTKAHSS